MAEVSAPSRPPGRDWRLFLPKSYTVLVQEGYRFGDLRADAVAGLTVAIVAAPLAMAIAIASGVTPQVGLLTAVIGGFVISALGGSRFQIGGPTGAFIVVVYGVIQAHGLDGLLIATAMAGLLLIVAGLLRLGDWIKYIPEPVVTGFTAGIAVIILTSQLRDFFGLSMAAPPAEFIAKMQAFWAARDSASAPAFLLAVACLAVILGLRRFAPKAPGFLIAVAGAALAVALLDLPVETIGSRFGETRLTLAAPHFPPVTFARLQELAPAAFTIAFLAGVESLLSAMVADGMTGRRHRSNCELAAQGVANLASAAFGGISVTGAIARTATNIRAGARTPIAGMLHALFLLVFVTGFGPVLAYVPLASLAAVLVVVAWNMSEHERFIGLLRAPGGERAVLLATFGLTVLVDLTLAIEVGVVLAAVLFMHRMGEATQVERGLSLLERDEDDLAGRRERYTARAELPPGVELFALRGPLFFGSAGRLSDAFEGVIVAPKAFVLRMGETPMVDASGARALERFLAQCQSKGAAVIVSELRPETRAALVQMRVLPDARVHEAASYAEALEIARRFASP